MRTGMAQEGRVLPIAFQPKARPADVPPDLKIKARLASWGRGREARPLSLVFEFSKQKAGRVAIPSDSKATLSTRGPLLHRQERTARKAQPFRLFLLFRTLLIHEGEKRKHFDCLHPWPPKAISTFSTSSTMADPLTKTHKHFDRFCFFCFCTPNPRGRTNVPISTL